MTVIATIRMASVFVLFLQSKTRKRNWSSYWILLRRERGTSEIFHNMRGGPPSTVLLQWLLFSSISNTVSGQIRSNNASTSALTKSGSSTGGRSTCLSGNIQVTVTSPNVRINLEQPGDQLAATELVVELLQANSTLGQRVVGSPAPLTDTFSVFSKLCLPKDPVLARKVDTVQFLTHGDTLSSTYWDIAPNYSYVDAVTAAGQAAFSYDRVGVGKSDHPDPLQVVQGTLAVEIAHALAGLLRGKKGAANSTRTFSKVIGVGHSAGSTVTQGVTTKYPETFDAIILTGTSTVATYVPLTLAGFDLQIAKEANASRFGRLPSGYWTQANSIGIQQGFFRYPNFDPQGESYIPRIWRQFDLLIRQSIRSLCRGKGHPDPGRAAHFGRNRGTVHQFHRPCRRCPWTERSGILWR